MIVELRGTALITGGTMGIGLETAVALGARGARCVMTYKWGSANEDDVRARFAQAGARPPEIYRADAANDDDTIALMARLQEITQGVDIFVSNVSAALIVQSINDYSRKDLHRSIDYSAWPVVSYTQKIKETFGQYPRYIVGLSSTGVDHFSKGYDFMAASKAVLEALCRYLNYRLSPEGVRVNVVRSLNVRTESLAATFGKEFEEFARGFIRERHYIDATEVADAIVALCSGLMDGFGGQILTVDRGMTFFDNLMRLYAERERLELR